MAPKLSDKMPATQDSQTSSRFPATMDSDAPPYAGEGGSAEAPDQPCSQATDPSVTYIAVDRERGIDWELKDRTMNDPSDKYSTNDRDNTGEGGLPQREEVS